MYECTTLRKSKQANFNEFRYENTSVKNAKHFDPIGFVDVDKTAN